VTNICKHASFLARLLIINFSDNYIEGDKPRVQRF